MLTNLCLSSDEALPVSDHLDEELERTLQHKGTVVWDVSEDEHGVDTSDIVSPAGKVSDDALK